MAILARSSLLKMSRLRAEQDETSDPWMSPSGNTFSAVNCESWHLDRAVWGPGC